VSGQETKQAVLSGDANRAPERSADRSSRLARSALFCAGFLALLVIPFIASSYFLAIAISIFIAVIGSVGTNLILGVAGQASIGTAALMAIGAFATAQTAVYYHWPFLAAVLAGGVASAVVGVLIAIPAMRVRGLYLIIATLALFYVATFLLTRYQAAKVGDTGFLLPQLTFGNLNPLVSWYYIIGAIAVVVVLVMGNLLRTRFGRAWSAMARDEVTTAVIGVRVRAEKIRVFAVSSFLIGIAGGLYGYYTGDVTIGVFTLDLAISYIAMCVIGGLGSVAGSVLGAVFVIGLPYLVTQLTDQLPATQAAFMSNHVFDLEVVVYGIAIVGFLVWERRGLAHLLSRAFSIAWSRLSGRRGTEASSE
jgi:branched-chain amino acid transport system permease protein